MVSSTSCRPVEAVRHLVQAAVAVEGVHRHFASLREAVPHILAFASAPHDHAAA